ncbi:MAG: methylmalonyl Co-A mutase-associated GTPase MeaB [Phycisphaerales bacterium]|nr:methylmalonyl Co-A mutase-associated GTPase MeaB [Phycisphaerales bacterium]
MTNSSDKFGLSVDKAAGAMPPASVASNKPIAKRRVLTLDDYEHGVVRADRAVLGRALSLIESVNPEHEPLARELLARVLKKTGGSIRVGITGVPGAGKSTFIERLGVTLADRGHKVAVLAVDPSSNISGGSILGDRTRMARLSAHPNAFIRPSPSSGALGGVARKTRESMLLCEAAGFDVVLIETVGVGQSETQVAEMSDFFLAIMIAGAGDELQGIKRGILELVDMIAVNKADGDNERRAKLAASEYAAAVRLFQHRDPNWSVPVTTCSAVSGVGVVEIWDRIRQRVDTLRSSGRLAELRRTQDLRWMHALLEEHLHRRLTESPEARAILAEAEHEVQNASVPPVVAAERAAEAVLREIAIRLQASK